MSKEMRSLREDRVLLVVVVLCCCLLQWTICLPLGESHGGIMWEKEPEDLCSLCQVGDFGSHHGAKNTRDSNMLMVF